LLVPAYRIMNNLARPACTREMNPMAKITIDSDLWDRAKRAAQSAGYSSVEEFVAHAIENELKKHEVEEAERQVSDQLRGLGYVE
jgi:hypothetical protein